MPISVVTLGWSGPRSMFLDALSANLTHIEDHGGVVISVQVVERPFGSVGTDLAEWIFAYVTVRTEQ